MLDDYQIPAIALIGALLPAFAYLAVRVRSARTVLWLLGLAFTEVEALLFWRVTMSVNPLIRWPFHGTLAPDSSWMVVVGYTTLTVASAFFLASLSPLSFRIGRWRILYVFPYIVPLVAYTILVSGPMVHPQGAQKVLLYLLAAATIFVAFLWSLRENVIPIWFAELIVLIAALGCIGYFRHNDFSGPMWIGISGNLMMTALLVLYAYRRATPGVLLTTVGLIVWAIPPFLCSLMHCTGSLLISLDRAWILSKVLFAVGLLLLAMEDEIDANVVASQRERRIRTELQSYAQQQLTMRSLAQFEEQAAAVCALIASESRFRRVALVLRGGAGRLKVAGSAGMDRATESALDIVLDRMPIDLLSEGLPLRVAETTAYNLDLARWLEPGDDLQRLRQTRFTAVLMRTAADAVDGAILLAGEREATPLTADDLLPLEILAARLRTARSQSFMLGRLIDADRATGTCHLAMRLVQQMHNPLTVILGYGSLLEETIPDGPERTASEAILLEARRMRSTIDRLTQLTRGHSERYSEFALRDLLADVEQLHRPDFLREAIEFSLQLDAGLPTMYGNQHRIRQVLMHLLDGAIFAVQSNRQQTQKSIVVKGMLHGDRVRIELRHSGAWIAHPERLFQALDSGAAADVTTGMGMSLSAEILREYGGSIAARNLAPEGVLITVDIPVRETPPRV